MVELNPEGFRYLSNHYSYIVIPFVVLLLLCLCSFMYWYIKKGYRLPSDKTMNKTIELGGHFVFFVTLIVICYISSVQIQNTYNYFVHKESTTLVSAWEVEFQDNLESFSPDKRNYISNRYDQDYAQNMNLVASSMGTGGSYSVIIVMFLLLFAIKNGVSAQWIETGKKEIASQ